MATINVYKNTEIDWKKVDFNLKGNQFKFKSYPLIFKSGVKFNYIESFQDVNDFTVNNDSFNVLLGLRKNTDIFNENNLPKNTNDYQQINTPITDLNGYFLKKDENDFLIDYNSNYNLNFNDSLSFIFENNKVIVKDFKNLYLTVTLINGVSGVKFLPQTIPFDKKTQYFDYFLGDESIVLFVNDTNYSYVLAKNNQNKISIAPYSFDLSKSIFSFASYKKKQNEYNDIKDSFLVTYNANPLLNQKNLNVAKKDFLNQNYLGVFSIKNYTIDTNSATFDLDISSLKNYQTVDYAYNTNDLNRIYTKIFTGTNQAKGHDLIHLGYQTSSVSIKFEPGLYTKFYFTPTVTSIKLDDSDLKESGSVGSYHPLISDRVYTKTKSKLDENPNLKIQEQTYQYLCSWFNGYAWYDRYYNSAFYSLDSALSASHLVYNEKFNPNQNFTFDVPSKMLLQPAVEYEYYRVGKKDIRNFIKLFNYKDNNGVLENTNILSITNWTSGSLVDDSTFHNDGITYFTDSNTFKGKEWVLDGTNYAIFPANKSLLPEDNLTVSLWLNVPDWGNITGTQIFGNYYNSGFGLINESGFIAPFISVFENNSKTLYNFNYRFATTSKRTLTIPNPKITFIQRLKDYSYWLFDVNNSSALYYSADDKLVNSLTLNINNISQVEVDSTGKVYVYDNFAKAYVTFYSYGDGLENGVNPDYGVVEQTTNRIEIDLNDNIIHVIGNASVIDNDNVLWESIGQNVYFAPDPNDRNNKILYGIFGNVNQITCDAYNNIWVFFDDIKFSKIDTERNIAFTQQFSKTPVKVKPNCPAPPPLVIETNFDLIEDLPFLSTRDYRYILDNRYEEILVDYPEKKYIVQFETDYRRKRTANFISSPVSTFSNSCGGRGVPGEDQLVLIDEVDNMAYVFNQLGEPLFKIDLNSLLGANQTASVATDGDFTGYQYLRKYQNSKGILSWNLNVKNGERTDFVKIPFDVSNLPKGWHNFSMVFDQKNRSVYCYVDSVNVGTYTGYSLDKHTILYPYASSLLIGTANIKYNILNNVLDVYNGYNFIGSISELKIYNIALNNDEIKQIYLSSDLIPDINPLNWNMQIGTRNYIEQIKHWFKFQLPSNKSKYFNINLHNLNVNSDLKTNIENAIKNVIKKISPAYTDLYKINWK